MKRNKSKFRVASDFIVAIALVVFMVNTSIASPLAVGTVLINNNYNFKFMNIKANTAATTTDCIIKSAISWDGPTQSAVVWAQGVSESQWAVTLAVGCPATSKVMTVVTFDVIDNNGLNWGNCSLITSVYPPNGFSASITNCTPPVPELPGYMNYTFSFTNSQTPLADVTYLAYVTVTVPYADGSLMYQP